MRRAALVWALGAFATGVTACSECAGTPSCHTQPLISYGGQFINHKSGAAVAGVRVDFKRVSGIEIDSDQFGAVSDARGFFTLRIGSLYNGTVTGDLTVTPPAPYPPYTVSNVTMRSSRVRGDGGFLGRLVVDPFFILVGEVHDPRGGGHLLSDATVTMRRLSGGRLAQDAITMVSEGSRFGWVDPPVLQFGAIDAEFDVQLPGDPRVFHVTQTVPMLYRDGDLAFVILLVEP